jgi:hypothetical protein
LPHWPGTTLAFKVFDWLSGIVHPLPDQRGGHCSDSPERRRTDANDGVDRAPRNECGHSSSAEAPRAVELWDALACLGCFTLVMGAQLGEDADRCGTVSRRLASNDCSTDQ